MAGRLSKSVSLRIVAEPGTAKEQLDAITLQADKLKEPIDLKIGAMGGEANAEITAMKDSLAGLDESARVSVEELSLLANEAINAGKGFEEASVPATSFKESLKGLGDNAAKVAEIERGLAEADNVLSRSMQASVKATIALADADKTLADAEKMVADGSIEQQAAMRQSKLRTDEQAAASSKLHGNMGMAAIGIGVVAAASVKMAGDFQQSTNKLVTSAGETDQNIGMVRAGMLKLSAQTATTTQELSSGMYMVESAGFHGASGLTVLKAAAEGARAEQAPLAEVTNAVTSALKSYHLGANDATAITNQMVSAVGHGKMTFADFAASLSTVLPIASSAKLSFAEVGGAIATLTNHGTSANEATQELANTIRNLQAPNNVAVQEMQRLGLSSVDVATHLGTRGLTGTIQLLQETVLQKMGPAGTLLLSTFNQTKQAASDANQMFQQLPKSVQGLAKSYADGTISSKTWHAELKLQPTTIANLLGQYATLENRTHGFNNQLKLGGPAAQTFNAAMKQMMGGSTGLNTALMLGGENMSSFKTNVAAVGAAGKHAGSDVKGWSDIQSTFNFKLDKAKISAKDTAIAFGSALMPAVSAILAPLSSFMGFIASSSAASTAFAVVIGGILTAAIGTKLVQGFMAAKTAGSQLITGLGKIPAMLGLQTVATEEATVAQEGLDVAMEANPIGIIIIAIVALVAVIILVVTHLKIIKEAWDASWKFIKRIFDDAFGWIKKHWPLILGILTGPIGLAVAIIVTHWNTIKNTFMDAWRAISSFFSGIWRNITGWVSSGISNVVGWFRQLPGKILSAVGNLGNLLWNVGASIINGLINGVKSAIGGIANVFSSITSMIPSWKGPPDKDKTLLFQNGQFIMQGLIGGVSSHIPSLKNTLGNVTNVIQNGVSAVGTSGGGGSRAPLQVTVNVQGVVGDAGATGRQIAQALNTYLRQTGQTQLVGA